MPCATGDVHFVAHASVILTTGLPKQVSYHRRRSPGNQRVDRESEKATVVLQRQRLRCASIPLGEGQSRSVWIARRWACSTSTPAIVRRSRRQIEARESGSPRTRRILFSNEPGEAGDARAQRPRKRPRRRYLSGTTRGQTPSHLKWVPITETRLSRRIECSRCLRCRMR
jgi:hypothetical protein